LVTQIPVNPIDLYSKFKKRKRATGNNTQIISVDDMNSSFEEETEWNV